MALGAIFAGASSIFGALSANKAAEAQEAAANRQIDLSERIYGETVDRFAPFYDSGTNALSALNFELGLGERPVFGAQAPYEIQQGEETRYRPATAGYFHDEASNNPANGGNGQEAYQATVYNVGDQSFDTYDRAQSFLDALPTTGGTEYQGFQKTPGYDFRLQQGTDTIEASAAAQGGLFSGNALKSLQQYGQDYASSEYNNYLNRLSTMASSGQSAAGNQANAGANHLSAASSALGNIGNAQAAGAIGVGNALQSGIQNLATNWGYQNALTPTA